MGQVVVDQDLRVTRQPEGPAPEAKGLAGEQATLVAHTPEQGVVARALLEGMQLRQQEARVGAGFRPASQDQQLRGPEGEAARLGALEALEAVAPGHLAALQTAGMVQPTREAGAAAHIIMLRVMAVPADQE